MSFRAVRVRFELPTLPFEKFCSIRLSTGIHELSTYRIFLVAVCYCFHVTPIVLFSVHFLVLNFTMSFYQRAHKLNQFSRFLHTFPGKAVSTRTSSGILATYQRGLSGFAPRLALFNAPAAVSNGCSFHRTSPRRNFSSQAPDDVPPRGRGRMLPKLMDFPEIIWPSVMKSVKNWIMVHFIIRPYFDREFSLPEFVQGAKQALQVSHYYSMGSL